MPTENRLRLDDEQRIFPTLQPAREQNESVRPARVKRGRLTERLRTMSCRRSKAFSMTSCGLLRAKSWMLPTVKEVLGGLVQDRRQF